MDVMISRNLGAPEGTAATLSLFASIIESSEDAIISKDLDGKILSWNRGATALYGYSAEEAIGLSINALIPPDRLNEEASILARIRAGERTQHFETVRLKKDGTPIQVSLAISPIQEGDRIVGASHVARDISERKRLEAANAQLAAIIESSEDAIISKDLDGTIRSWNAAAQRVYGYSAEDAIGRNIRFILPAGCEAEEAHIISQIKLGARMEHFETRRRKQDGTLIDVSLTISPIRNRAGEVIGVSHVAREITQRRKLETSNAHLAAIVKSSEDAIISKDLTGVIQTWNGGAERIYGYSEVEAIGRNIAFLLPVDRASEEQEILSKLRNGERVEHFETTRLRKDGTLIDVSLSVSPIRDAADRVIGASHVARDITARKRLEQQMRDAQRLESLGVLAGGIAHDFNNLLTGIIGNASLLSDTQPMSYSAQGLLKELTLAADRAADLTRQMLAYSGGGQFVIESTHLSEVTAEISELIKGSISKNVTVRLDLERNIPMIEADRSQIQQVIMNLIINGAEAVGDYRSGTVVVRTGALRLDEQQIRLDFSGSELRPGEYTFLEVQDDGCGMDEETKSRIFDPFFTTKFTGRGLGLAATLGIVSAHKGSIRVHSVPGEGTSFRVLFPATDRDRLKLPGWRKSTGKGLVLVVDDEDMVRKVAKSSLESHGYEVVLATNGKEAVDLLSSNPEAIALIILDLAMPTMGGEEAIRHLRAINPTLPVILSSGYSESEVMRRFAGHTLSGFLQKPYSSSRLRAAVDSVLAERQRPS
jgi:PAS domain S-box-containing protein